MAPASSIDSPVLTDIVVRLVAAYHPERSDLFGSVARGDAGPDSDHDVLVVVADDAEPDRSASRPGYEALVGTGFAADITWPAQQVITFDRGERG